MPKAAERSTARIATLLFKQYPGQQQVDLKVKIGVPGSWFGAGAQGALTVTERQDRYEAVAVEYEEKHIFQPATGKKPAVVKEAIRFVCHADAADDDDHAGFWMDLTSWNRYRHDTYKDNREAEVRCSFAPFVPCALASAVALVFDYSRTC